MLTRSQLATQIAQLITDPLNKQNTAADVRAMAQLLVDNCANLTEDGLVPLKSDFLATRAPLPTDDTTAQWVVGSKWLFGNKYYVAVDVTENAAIWSLTQELDNVPAAELYPVSSGVVQVNATLGLAYVNVTEEVTNISVINSTDGSRGLIALFQGPTPHPVAVTGSTMGVLDVSTEPNAISLIEWVNINGTVYLTSASSSGLFKADEVFTMIVDLDYLGKSWQLFQQSGSVTFQKGTSTFVPGGTGILAFNSDGGTLTWGSEFGDAGDGQTSSLPSTLPAGLHYIYFLYNPTDIAGSAEILVSIPSTSSTGATGIPTLVSLSANSIDENLPANTLIGILTANGDQPITSFALSGGDAASFTVVDNAGSFELRTSSSLAQGTYNFGAIATNALGTQAVSTQLTVNVNAVGQPTLDQVTGVSFSASATDGELDGTWTAVANATGYVISYADDAGMTVNVQTLSVSTNSGTITGLGNSVTKHMTVRATAPGYNDGAESSPSVSATTNAGSLPTLGQVANAVFVQGSDLGEIDGSWDALANATEYVVTQADDAGMSINVTTETVSSGTTISKTSLGDDVTKYYTVHGRNPGNYNDGPASVVDSAKTYGVGDAANLELQFEADQGITEIAGDVSSWADQAGVHAGFVADQSTPADRPAYTSGSPGTAKLTFDNDDQLDSVLLGTAIASTNGISKFLVLEVNSLDQSLRWIQGSSSSGNRHHVAISSGDKVFLNQGTFLEFSAGTVLPVGSKILLTVRYNPTDGLTYVRLNGSDYGVALDVGSNTFDGISFGEVNGAGTINPALMDFYSFFLTSDYKTGADLTKQEQAIINKYGITV